MLGVLFVVHTAWWLWHSMLPRSDLTPVISCREEQEERGEEAPGHSEGTDEKVGEGPSKRLAVVMPFFARQIDRLVYNFRMWRKFLPCSGEHPLPRPTDLLLYYDLNDPEDMRLTRSVLEGYTDDFQWEPFRCFAHINVITANLTHMESETHPRSVPLHPLSPAAC